MIFDFYFFFFFFQAEDGIRDFCLSRGLGDVYKRQDEDCNNITFMLESNVNVFIFDNDINLIYRSSDEAGVTSYFDRYYSTTKTIAGTSNKVISLGLIDGNYYIVFKVKDATATTGYHLSLIHI